MKFNIKNMARINEATINIRPLTVFIGKNGTNKSYMAHFVYEIYKEINALDESGLFNESKLAQTILREYLNDTSYDSKKLKLAILENKKKYERYQIDEDDFETIEYDEYIFDVEKLNEMNLLSEINNFVIKEILKKINKSYNAQFEIVEELFFDYDLAVIFNTKLINIQVPEGGKYLGSHP